MMNHSSKEEQPSAEISGSKKQRTARNLLEKVTSTSIAFLKKPEVIVLLLLVFVRLFFIIWSSWGIDFDFYLEIAQDVVAGQRLYSDIQSTHMPLVDLLYIMMYVLCPWKNNLYAIRIFFKLPFLLSDIGIALAVMKIIEKESVRSHEPLSEREITKRKLVAGFFVALALPLILQTGGGRYDSLMIFSFTMVVYCLQREDWFGMAFFAALGTSAKYIGIIFLPFAIFWIKKKNWLQLIGGLALGFLPLYPFLLLQPVEFVEAIFLRGSHIAYGFALWHAIYILWNGFNMKYVAGIEGTYNSADEPWFVSDLYMPFFIAVFSCLLVLYLIRWWKIFRVEKISDQPLVVLLNIVFIPLFTFALTFKAINIQVLAWFTPYIALKKRLGLLLEYSVLTLVNGVSLVMFTAYNSSSFSQMIAQAAGEGSVFYVILIKPVLWFISAIPEQFIVGIIFMTIIWYLVRTSIELGKCSRELKLLSKTHDSLSGLIANSSSNSSI